MEQCTPLECALIVKIYIRYNYSIVNTQREFREKFKSRSAPAKNTIKKIYEKLTLTTYFGNSKKPNQPKPNRSDASLDS